MVSSDVFERPVMKIVVLNELKNDGEPILSSGNTSMQKYINGFKKEHNCPYYSGCSFFFIQNLNYDIM